MQLRRAVLAAQPLDTVLELVGAGGADGQRDRRLQQRRVVAAREVLLELAHELRARCGVRRRAVVAVGLLVVDVVGVDDPAADEPHGLGVGDEARAERGVDGKLERLQRREQELRRAPGERDGVGQRADAEERLVAVAVLGLDPQRARLDVDRRVHQPQDVDLERLVRALALGTVDHQRLRLEALLDDGSPTPRQNPRWISHCSSWLAAGSRRGSRGSAGGPSSARRGRR